MIKIIISEKFTDETSLVDGLNHIISLIEQGNTSGYYPTWELKTSTEKDEQIEKIKSIIQKWGETTSTKLELNGSPCIESHTAGGRNTSKLIEEFNESSVNVITYLDETEIDEDDIDYEDLSDEIIDEICNLMETYDLNEQELHDSCRNENWD